MLPHTPELDTTSGPKRDTSRPVPAWPLRHRPLLDDAGWFVPAPPAVRDGFGSERFEQGFLNEHGLAQVGLDPPFTPEHQVAPFETG